MQRSLWVPAMRENCAFRPEKCQDRQAGRPLAGKAAFWAALGPESMKRKLSSSSSEAYYFPLLPAAGGLARVHMQYFKRN